MPLFMSCIEAHVLRRRHGLHGDDTTVPVLAKRQAPIPARLWTYVRDDRPFGGRRPAGGGVPLSPAIGPRRTSRRRISPAGSGILQADAYGGYNDLYATAIVKPAPVLAALLLGPHARRKVLRTGRYRGQHRARRHKRANEISPIRCGSRR
ncbi:MAG: transposase [Cypionkella sp.]